MASVYTSDEFQKLFAQQFQDVSTYFSSNPGKDISDCTTALNIPFQIVYAIVEMDANLIYLPSTSTEVSFSHGRHKG